MAAHTVKFRPSFFNGALFIFWLFDWGMNISSYSLLVKT